MDRVDLDRVTDHHSVPSIEVFKANEHYRMATVDEMDRVVTYPQEAGKLMHILNDHYGFHLVFTWLRPDNNWTMHDLSVGKPPSYRQWYEHEPENPLWVVDMAQYKVPAIKVGRLIGTALVEAGIAEDGEMVLFHRKNGRIGGFRARSRLTIGQEDT